MEWKEEEPKCPACGAAAAAKALECAACGVVFEKWRKKLEREPPPSERVAGEPPPVRASESGRPSFFKPVGGAFLLVAVSLIGWLVSGGSSRAPVAGSSPDQERGYSISAPAGWRDLPDKTCGGLWDACTIRLIDRGETPQNRFLERLTVRAIPRGPGALTISGREELEAKLKAEIGADMGGEFAIAPVSAATFDGVAGFRLEGRGKKHFKVETAAAVVTNAQSALAEQKRLNPGQAVYSVMATYNPHTLNPTVTLKEAEYAEFDARPVLGRIVLPLRASLLLLSYQYDEADEASFTSGLDEALASLRVLKRPRPMDGLSGLAVFLTLGFAAWSTFMGLKLLSA